MPEDPVLDYMVMEAVAIRIRAEDKEANRQQQIAQWKKDEMARLAREEYGSNNKP